MNCMYRRYSIVSLTLKAKCSIIYQKPHKNFTIEKSIIEGNAVDYVKLALCAKSIID